MDYQNQSPTISRKKPQHLKEKISFFKKKKKKPQHLASSSLKHYQKRRARHLKEKPFPKILKFLLLFILFAGLIVSSILLFIYYGPLEKINYNFLPTIQTVHDSIQEEGATETKPLPQTPQPEESDTNVQTPIHLTELAQNLKNIVFFGLDVRAEGSESGRSDIIMILSMDEENKQLKAASILRDCYVPIPGHGKSRINAAYAYGGPSLALETINTNFSTNLQKYVKIDFYGMAKIIDLIGGIQLDEISKEEALQLQKSGYDIQAGANVLLNGNEAVSYARIRKTDNDFCRTDRQRKVLQQIFLKLYDMDFARLIPLLDDILPNLETNLTKNEIVSLGWHIISSGYSTDLQELSIPLDDAYQFATINGAAVILPDMDKNTEALQAFLYGNNSTDK